MATKGSKRIRDSTVLNWLAEHWKALSLSSTSLAIALISYLALTGSITILDYSGDMNCAGTPDDLCVAEITFKANTDIFIYPSENWGLEVDKPIKNLKMYRTWGDGATVEKMRAGITKGTRRIDLTKTCTGTWCGGTGKYDPAYSFAFRTNRTYTIFYTAEKIDPDDNIKWGFGFDTPLLPHEVERDYVDPTWFGNQSRIPSKTRSQFERATSLFNQSLIKNTIIYTEFRDRKIVDYETKINISYYEVCLTGNVSKELECHQEEQRERVPDYTKPIYQYGPIEFIGYNGNIYPFDDVGCYVCNSVTDLNTGASRTGILALCIDKKDGYSEARGEQFQCTLRLGEQGRIINLVNTDRIFELKNAR